MYGALSAAQGGLPTTKPTTQAGTPNDGAVTNEFGRPLRATNDFVAKAFGVYAQDMVEFLPGWKVLGGLRYDNMDGHYNAYAVPANVVTPVTTTTYTQKISEVSYRAAILFQPTPLQSYHLSYGTSFNTSGDTYSYNAQSANTLPESSSNIELGARLDSEDKRFTTRFALFRSTKLHERNVDPDTAATRLLLSGKRHTAGVEIDLSGRITPNWELYALTWGCRSPGLTRQPLPQPPWATASVIAWTKPKAQRDGMEHLPDHIETARRCWAQFPPAAGAG
ncbi:MAG: TonB-dependent receptor [Burkholderiales bacterium]